MKHVFVLLILFPVVLSAQNGGSVLSRFGVGELDNLSSARQRGMGHSGAAMSHYDVHATNPAAWSFVNGLRLQGTLAHEYESSSKSEDLSYGTFKFKGLQFALPLEESWHTRLAMGLHALSSIGYELSATGSHNGSAYTAEYAGSGGLAFASVGFGARPLPFLSVGAAMRWYFGTIDHRMTVNFSNAEFFDTDQRRSTSHGGGGYAIGAAYTGIDGLTLTASLTTASALDASRDVTYAYSTHDSTIRGVEDIQDLPVRYQGGLAWELSPRWTIAADYTMQDWTGARVFGVEQTELTSGFRIGVGAEWKPMAGGTQANSWRTMMLRFGFTHQKLPVYLDGAEQKETFGTLGLGIPVWGDSRADMALEAGVRGASTDVLGSRLMLRFTLSVSVGENWFVRRDTEE